MKWLQKGLWAGCMNWGGLGKCGLGQDGKEDKLEVGFYLKREAEEMDLGLKDRVALVSGASQGIGRATALAR